jgi:chromosome partitioning protein
MTTMRTWAIANQKGGVGKTTTTAALGGLLAEQGKRVLLVDMDPQASLTGYFKLAADTGSGAYTLFAESAQHAALPNLLHDTGRSHLSLLPSVPALATLDRQLGRRNGMGLVLRQALDAVDEDFDYVLIDCPPMLGVLMINALAACDRLLIPTQTEFLALRGLERMLESLNMIERSLRISLPFTIVPTLFDARTHASQSSLDILRNRHGDHVADNVIPTDTQVREASAAGVPASLWMQARRAAPSYHLLLDELLASEPAVEEALA